MNNCEWLSPLIKYDSSDEWINYENYIYSIFRADFIDSYPFMDELRVNIRRHPIENGKEEAFYHVTCQDYLNSRNRFPDFRRCERIKWVREFIENTDCSKICTLCSGIKIWDKPYKSTYRKHIMLEKEKYLVVLERREKYFLLITAFYIDQEHTLNKKIKEYGRFCDSKKRL